MTRTVEKLLDTFDRLPEPEQREVASEILRRFRRIAVDPISNDESNPERGESVPGDRPARGNQ
jgi:hypothetical protein